MNHVVYYNNWNGSKWKHSPWIFQRIMGHANERGNKPINKKHERTDREKVIDPPAHQETTTKKGMFVWGSSWRRSAEAYGAAPSGRAFSTGPCSGTGTCQSNAPSNRARPSVQTSLRLPKTSDFRKRQSDRTRPERQTKVRVMIYRCMSRLKA